MEATSEKLLLAKCEDLFTLCDKYCYPRFSDFLDGAEQAVLQDKMTFTYGAKTLMFGGFDDAEKKILGVFPEWTEPDISEFPISCIKVEGGFSRKLTHRDYMGTVMSLGITPSKLGDIIADDGFAYIFLHNDMVDYIADNLHKIGNQGVKVTKVEDMQSIKVERQYKTIGAVCASERLDAVTAAAANVSRAVSAGLIEGGKVKLNHREITKTSEPVKEGDLLSIRGHGRFLIYKFGGETRKNRLHITLKQYI